MPQLLTSEKGALTHAIELSMAQLKDIFLKGGTKAIATIPLGGCVEIAGITKVEIPTVDDCTLTIEDANASELATVGLAFDSIVGESSFNNGTAFSGYTLPIGTAGPVLLNVSNFIGNGAKTGRVIITLRILDPLSLVNY